VALQNIRGEARYWADIEKKGSIQITGAMYDLATGVVDFRQLAGFSCSKRTTDWFHRKLWVC